MTVAAAPAPHAAPRATPRPRPAQALRPDAIPDELKARPQWVVWRYGSTSSQKIPLTPATGAAASSTDPATWGTFAEALGAWRRSGRLAGIGYVFSADDPFCGIDWDGCYDLGGLSPRVADAVARAGSYAERSPSGKGVKMFVRGRLDGPGARSPRLGVEIYDRARFFTLTGDILDGAPRAIGDAQDLVSEIARAISPTPAPHAGPGAARLVQLPDAGAVPELAPGGAVRRPDGTLRRVKPDHWLNAYLLGDDRPFLDLAARRGWDAGDSGLRFHGFETLWLHGFPEAEIAAIARALLPQAQKNRDTAKWWAREVHDCLYGPKGAATRWPAIPRNPTRGFVAPPPPPDAPQGGRPQALSSAELLRYYGEEAGKRELVGPRRRDAEALGVSVPTLDRLDRQLRLDGAIRVELLPGRAGRRVILLGTIKTPPAGPPAEVLSAAPAAEPAERATTPQHDDPAPQCIGESHLSLAPSPCPAPAEPAPSLDDLTDAERAALLERVRLAAQEVRRPQERVITRGPQAGLIVERRPRATPARVAEQLPADAPALVAEALAWLRSWGAEAERLRQVEGPQDLYRELRGILGKLHRAEQPAPAPWAALEPAERARLAARRRHLAEGDAGALLLAEAAHRKALEVHRGLVRQRGRNEVLADMLRRELRRRGLPDAPPPAERGGARRGKAPTGATVALARARQEAECWEALDRLVERAQARTPARPVVRVAPSPAPAGCAPPAARPSTGPTDAELAAARVRMVERARAGLALVERSVTCAD